jgi:tetratricopeptide (TPR) repeat protein
MGKCWTCGSKMAVSSFTCPSCNGLKQLKDLNEEAKNLSKGLKNLGEIQYEAFNELKDVFSDKLSEVVSAIEWGFHEISWHLEQQTEVLRSIDNTLRTPMQTQANEWRLMADELNRRGVLDEAEKYYLKSIELNLLDYRTYLGLAHLYIEISEFDKAKNILEKSLPHAPKKEIDYKSYSFRLIGHIYECREDYGAASSILHNAVELSPNYVDGHYDYSRYSAQVGNLKACIPSLNYAIQGNPLYWDLAKSERTFLPMTREIMRVLQDFKTDGVNRVNNSIADTENYLLRSKEAIEEAFIALDNSGDQAQLVSALEYQKVADDLSRAKQKTDSLTYQELLNLDICIKEYSKDINNIINLANQEKHTYLKRLTDKIRNRDQRISIGLKYIFLGGFWGGVPGCVVGFPKNAAFVGWLIGAGIGIIVGLLIAFKREMPDKIR